MSDPLTGKTAIVTGSTRGIGREIALRFASAGANVVLHGTDANRAAQVTAAIASAGGRSALFLGDAGTNSFGDDLVGVAMEHFGGVDILVANAGMVDFEPFLETTGERFGRYLDVHVKGAYLSTQAAAKAMIAGARPGRILMMASISGVHAMYGYTPYCAAKAAVMSLARTAALELAPHGIHVNAIAPGPVRNEMMEHLWGPEKLAERCRTIPAGRLASAADVAEMAMFLVSPAADYITGQTLFLDGGAMAAGLYTHEVFKRSRP